MFARGSEKASGRTDATEPSAPGRRCARRSGSLRALWLGRLARRPRRSRRRARGEVCRLSGVCALLPRDRSQGSRVLGVVGGRRRGRGRRRAHERLHFGGVERVRLSFRRREDHATGFVARRFPELEDPAVPQGERRGRRRCRCRPGQQRPERQNREQGVVQADNSLRRIRSQRNPADRATLRVSVGIAARSSWRDVNQRAAAAPGARRTSP